MIGWLNICVQAGVPNKVVTECVRASGQFQRYGCDIWTQNYKQNPSEKLLFLDYKKY